MLKDVPLMVSFTVDDLDKAKEFYAEVLGLTVVQEMGVLQIKPKDGKMIMIYPKPNHKPATYTLLNFTVDDLAQTMSEMKAKGVVFEQYDLPEQNLKTDVNGVADYGMMKIAFFNDPAGNNHAVLQMTAKN